MYGRCQNLLNYGNLCFVMISIPALLPPLNSSRALIFLASVAAPVYLTIYLYPAGVCLLSENAEEFASSLASRIVSG